MIYSVLPAGCVYWPSKCTQISIRFRQTWPRTQRTCCLLPAMFPVSEAIFNICSRLMSKKPVKAGRTGTLMLQLFGSLVNVLLLYVISLSLQCSRDEMNQPVVSSTKSQCQLFFTSLWIIAENNLCDKHTQVYNILAEHNNTVALRAEGSTTQENTCKCTKSQTYWQLLLLLKAEIILTGARHVMSCGHSGPMSVLQTHIFLPAAITSTYSHIYICNHDNKS